jgi:hypothetical protein
MAHTYMIFDFGSDEEKLQQARHKLEGWKQAFRLDKKLQFKFDRGDASATAPQGGDESETQQAEVTEKQPSKSGKSPKGKAKSDSKTGNKAAKAAAKEAVAGGGDVKLLVRLYFSGHEKLSEQRWLDRIPAEEPFREASPRVVQEGEPGFSEALAQFDRLD